MTFKNITIALTVISSLLTIFIWYKESRGLQLKAYIDILIYETPKITEYKLIEAYPSFGLDSIIDDTNFAKRISYSSYFREKDTLTKLDSIVLLTRFDHMATIVLHNRSNTPLKKINIDVKPDNHIFDSYYEILNKKRKISNNGFFKNYFEVPYLSPGDSIKILVWADKVRFNNFHISQGGQYIKPTEIVRTSGIFAWASRKLSSFQGIITYLITPCLLIISFIMIIRDIK